jgi:hypothetical protein
VIGRIRRRLQSYLSDRKLAHGLRHVSGPQRIDLAPDAAGVVILAKDADWYLADCIDHHLGLGAAHVVVIDAASDDRTAAIGKDRPQVTLLATDLPLASFESGLRTAAARRVFHGGWILFAEPDELVEPPVQLNRLLSYTNARGFTAILGQILDFGPGTAATDSYLNARATGTYTTQGLEWVPYGDPSFHLDWFTRNNRAPDPDVRMLAGGLRKLVFGEDPVLTKHVLVRNLPEVELMSHPHCAGNVAVADVTIAMRRYMFAGDWQARDRTTVAAGTWDHGEDRQRLAVAATPGFVFAMPSPQHWTGPAALFETGFLYASGAARSALNLP